MLPNFHMYVCRYVRHRRLLCLVCTNVITVMEDFLLICDTKKCHIELFFFSTAIKGYVYI